MYSVFYSVFLNQHQKVEVEVLRFFSNDDRGCTPFFKNGVKNGVHTLLFFDKNGVPQLSLFDVKSENGVKYGVKNGV